MTSKVVMVESPKEDLINRVLKTSVHLRVDETDRKLEAFEREVSIRLNNYLHKLDEYEGMRGRIEALERRLCNNQFVMMYWKNRMEQEEDRNQSTCEHAEPREPNEPPLYCRAPGETMVSLGGARLCARHARERMEAKLAADRPAWWKRWLRGCGFASLAGLVGVAVAVALGA